MHEKRGKEKRPRPRPAVVRSASAPGSRLASEVVGSNWKVIRSDNLLVRASFRDVTLQMVYTGSDTSDPRAPWQPLMWRCKIAQTLIRGIPSKLSTILFLLLENKLGCFVRNSSDGAAAVFSE